MAQADPTLRPQAERALERIAGVSEWSRRLREDILRIARHPSNVLVLGPSGTGKELIARAIHAASPRVEKPFIPVDCAVTTGSLFASHMFGHVKGAFTGAVSSALGCFRAADGGTIFLDELGEMEPELQAKLLRVLQERAVVPVGSHQEIPVNVRVVAATNRSLAAEVERGRFREDLYYRLNVVAIQTLPLKDRVEDIPVIAQRYLSQLASRHGMPARTLSDAAIDLLCRYSWPGNVRELENVLERAVMFSSGDEIEPDLLSSLECGGAAAPEAAGDDSPLENAARRGVVAPTLISGVYRVSPHPMAGHGVKELRPVVGEWPTLADVERMHLERTLAEALNNKSLTAKLLDIDRSVLRRKLQRHGIDKAGGERQG